MPRVSVILAAFNGEPYLREAIDSILGQDYSDFELIAVDDGSTDNTRAILDSYDDPRVIRLDNPRNLGLAASLNRALAIARGEFVARQDADDISEPQRLGAQVEYFDRHSHVALVGSWFTVIDECGAEIRTTTLPVDDLDLRWAMFFFCPFVHSATMWRHAPVRQQVGAYDERLSYALDHDLWSRIASCFAVANLGAFLVRYREHARSMTETYGERTGEAHRLHVAAIAEALGWNGVSDDERSARFRAMAALVRESQLADLTPVEADRAAHDMLALQSALCNRNSVDRRIAARHRRVLRARISEGLVRVSRRVAARDKTGARHILRTAYRVYWRALAHRAAARLAPRLLKHPGRRRVDRGA